MIKLRRVTKAVRTLAVRSPLPAGPPPIKLEQSSLIQGRALDRMVGKV